MSINSTLIAQIIVFLILIWFTMKFVWPPITAALDERARKIAEGLSAADRAFETWGTREWPKLRRRCMRLDRSWGRSAQRYEEVYRAAIGPVLS